MERIAIVSDIHGNLTALTAVLADIDRRGVSRIINLGDVVGKGPRGSECVSLSRERCEVTVRGNWDDFLPEPSKAESDDALRWWHQQLSTEDRAWLKALPLVHELRIGGRTVRLFHASAESIYTRVQFRHSPEEFAGMFSNTELTGFDSTASVVCYGDIHDAYLEVTEGRTLINVGSVGDPLDELDASYVILEGATEEGEPFGVQFVRVPYDREAEIAVAARLGMPALEPYAIELRTAIFRGRHAELGLTMK